MGAEFSEAVVAQAFVRSGGQCECVDLYCDVIHIGRCQTRFSLGQRTTLDRVGYQADHFVPYSIGGPPTLENCQILCVPCHKSKTAKQSILAQFLKLKR
jgi:5-methylcytosine-specific restriction protein A